MEPGYSVEMKADSMDMFSFPGETKGWWRSEDAKMILEGPRVI